MSVSCSSVLPWGEKVVYIHASILKSADRARLLHVPTSPAAVSFSAPASANRGRQLQDAAYRRRQISAPGCIVHARDKKNPIGIDSCLANGKYLAIHSARDQQSQLKQTIQFAHLCPQVQYQVVFVWSAGAHGAQKDRCITDGGTRPNGGNNKSVAQRAKSFTGPAQEAILKFLNNF